MTTMYAARHRQGQLILAGMIEAMNVDWALHRSHTERPPRLVCHSGKFQVVQGGPLSPDDGDYEAVQQAAVRILHTRRSPSEWSGDPSLPQRVT